jgi:Fe-S-cluster-containing dehydrogenase component
MDELTEKREGFLRKKQSRRDFLKATGISLTGAFVALTLGGATSVKTRDGKDIKVWKTPTGVIVHDPNRCVGCLRCEAMCTARNDGKVSAYLARLKVTRNMNYGVEGAGSAYQKVDGQMGNFRIVAETCRQCEKPACGNACPTGAIYADKVNGARVVNVKACIGCGSCTRACPWHLPTVDPEAEVSTKCSLCEGDPTCVKSCPTGALRYLPWAEAEKLLWGTDATSGASPDA